MWLALGALLAIACVVLVALPFLRDPQPLDDRLGAPTEPEQERIELAEERDRALAALKELEFDHRTGKVSDDDYFRDLSTKIALTSQTNLPRDAILSYNDDVWSASARVYVAASIARSSAVPRASL